MTNLNLQSLKNLRDFYDGRTFLPEYTKTKMIKIILEQLIVLHTRLDELEALTVCGEKPDG